MDLSRSVERFLQPQERTYSAALREIQNGRKVSHWMWYIFPQLRGLGQSSESWYYGIADLEEAKAYLEHPVLGWRLREITQAALALCETDAMQVFGWPDCMKFHSCMTLFALVCGDDLFKKALTRYFDGVEDMATKNLLETKGI